MKWNKNYNLQLTFNTTNLQTALKISPDRGNKWKNTPNPQPLEKIPRQTNYGNGK